MANPQTESRGVSGMQNAHAQSAVKEKKKRQFKMPHLFWIMLGLILIMSIMTYIIPAGNFAKDAKGALIGTQFDYVGSQTPVSPWQAGMLFMDGLTGSAIIIFIVMVLGASIQVTMDTGAIDDLLNWSIAKLSTKGTNVLIPALFVLMVYIGSFGGSDALIAVVPIGVLFAKKLRLDPIVGLGVTTFATLIGFGTGPTKLMVPQAMMNVPVFSGFGARFIIQNVFMLIGLFFVMRYVKKIQKNPAASALGNTDWQKDLAVADEPVLKTGTLSWRTIVILVLFLGQYGLFVWWGLLPNGGSTLFAFMTIVSIIVAIISGFVAKMSSDDIGNSFAKGFASMAFVGFAIGMARVVSLIMTQGQILHTIVHTLTRPLMGLNQGISLIGMTGIISVINVLIPSASSKAAILIPIIQPITQALNINPQLAVQAFQFGDGFTNLISPILGWTIGSCVMAKVPFDKWFKWVFPKVLLMTILSFIVMYILYAIGWTGM